MFSIRRYCSGPGLRDRAHFQRISQAFAQDILNSQYLFLRLPGFVVQLVLCLIQYQHIGFGQRHRHRIITISVIFPGATRRFTPLSLFPWNKLEQETPMRGKMPLDRGPATVHVRRERECFSIHRIKYDDLPFTLQTDLCSCPVPFFIRVAKENVALLFFVTDLMDDAICTSALRYANFGCVIEQADIDLAIGFDGLCHLRMRHFNALASACKISHTLRRHRINQ